MSLLTLLLLFSQKVVSDSLWLHGLQHTGLQLSSLSPGVCSNWYPLSQWCQLMISSSLPALNLSQHQDLFQWTSSLHQVLDQVLHQVSGIKYWSFSFSISPSNEYSELISFGIDWLDLLALQGTFSTPLQHHNSIVLVLWCSAFFMV